LVVPTLLAGCPSDGTSATGDDSSDTGSSDGSSSSSTSLDPETSLSTTLDPTVVTTVDPDSSSSSSSDESTSGFVGCGDGDVDLQGGETCDGENLDGRTCVTEDFAGGELACNADCTLDTSGCLYECGDGEVQGDEQCEGNDLDGGTCVTEGFDGGDLECNADCSYDLAGCENYICGDGIVAGPEVCDGANLDGEDCESQDFDSGTLACAADCNSFDVSSCYVCGDGVINGTEDCDGAALGGETCLSLGTDGGVLSCASDCTFDVDECVGCGNGDQDPGEDCDINDFGGTTCVQLGFDGGTPTCTAACTIVTDSCAGLHTFCTSPNAAIGPGAGELTQSAIPVAGLAGEVIDVDVLVTGTHTSVGDLVIDVRHVGTNQTVSLANNQCGAGDDINATFDQDAAAPPSCVGTPTMSGAVQPAGNLDGYVNEALGPGNGSWELSVLDEVANNGGTLAQWCVAITTGSTLRPDLMLCGGSGVDVATFIPDGVELNVVESCTPDENTQAILITRSGIFDGQVIQDYVQNGGVVLTEYSITDNVFNAVFDEMVPGDGGQMGSCNDIAPTVVQFTPGDPFWAENEFVAIQLFESGCGANNIIDYPGVVPLAGWSDAQVSIGYRDDGPGRMWLTEFDWSDGQMVDFTYSAQLMGSMIVTDN
jgi:subtilisin-like proprotein convertase family protein